MKIRLLGVKRHVFNEYAKEIKHSRKWVVQRPGNVQFENGFSRLKCFTRVQINKNPCKKCKTTCNKRH